MNLKTVFLLVPSSVIVALMGGCNSTSTQTAATPPQSFRQPAQDPSLPAPARQGAARMEQQKRQMDAMRAADAAKAK